jgi:hypothetical protein
MFGPMIQPDPESPRDDNSVLSVHLAEYQALTTRITYWISILYISYSVMAVLLAFIVQQWSKGNHASILLRGSFAFELVVWAWVQACWEMSNIALFLETKLKPKIAHLLFVKSKSFLSWDAYIARQRSQGFDKFESRQSLLVLLLLTVVILVGPFLVKIGFHLTLPLLHSMLLRICCLIRSYWQWLFLDIYVVVMISLRSLRMMQIQKELEIAVSENQAS